MKEKFYIAKSKICGCGIFAARDLREREILFSFKGKLIEGNYQNPKYGLVWLQIGTKKWIIPEGEGRWINHSCNPNAAVKGDRAFVTLRPIKKGDEITYDYSTTEDPDYDKPVLAHCRCGAKECRKVIWGYSKLPVRWKRKYKNHISSWIK